MRAMIETEKPARNKWDLKLLPGGLIDLEFIAQVARLTGAVAGPGDGPAMTATADILAHLDEDFAEPQICEDLADAHQLYSTLMQVLRLCLEGEPEPDDMPPGLVDLLCRSTDLPEIKVLEAHLAETAKRVRGHFRSIIG